MREQLESIVKIQDKASRLVDQLLALAFADEISGSLKLEPVRLDTIVREAMLRFISKADERGIDLGASGIDEPVAVLGNTALLEGVVNNLVDNACRHAFPSVTGRAERAITVSLSSISMAPAGGRRLRLTVTDNGVGLPDAMRSAVLQRWKRVARDPLLREGSGLGLAIVSEYARLLGARLSLETGQDGIGLSVSLEFECPPA